MKIPEDVLAALSSSSTSGSSLTLTGKLDRAMYVAVNKVLEAAGGKWSKKAKVHVFDGDAASIIDAVITAGEIDVVKRGADGWFPTPQSLATRLVQLADVQPGHTVLEPSAGEGALVRACLDVGVKAEDIVCCEVNPGRVSQLKDLHVIVEALDFMELERTKYEVDRVVMNPPFCRVGQGDHLDHVQHAYGFLKPGGVLAAILPAGVIFRQDRRYTAFRTWAEANNGVITKLPSGSFKASGTGVETVTLVMKK